MIKNRIKQIIENKIVNDGIFKTGIDGVYLFKFSHSRLCEPAVYKPAIIAIVNGNKEVIIDGKSFKYDNSKYLCCTMTLPVEAGTPNATKDNPLLGVYISLDTKTMTELTIGMQNINGAQKNPKKNMFPSGLAFSTWNDSFTDALLRLLLIINNPSDREILGRGRLKELYYSVLKGEAGESAKVAFGLENEVSRSIIYLSSNLEKPITIEDMAKHVGMSRAVFHRKFRQATTMSPIQFVKSMRLNSAAMKMATGMNVSEAAFKVGYSSTSQFSREFKRLYGYSPKQWSNNNQIPKESIQNSDNQFSQFKL